MPVSIFTPYDLLKLATLTPHRPHSTPRPVSHIQQPPVCTQDQGSSSARTVTLPPPVGCSWAPLDSRPGAFDWLLLGDVA